VTLNTLLVTINRPAKFKVSKSTTTNIQKAIQNVEIGMVWAVWGHPRSPKTIR